MHSKAKEAVDLWLERSCLASNPSAPIFPSFGKNRESIELRRLDRRSALKLVEKRARTSGILKRVCCHSFRATGVTEYMNSGGTIEIAQRILKEYRCWPSCSLLERRGNLVVSDTTG